MGERGEKSLQVLCGLYRRFFATTPCKEAANFTEDVLFPRERQATYLVELGVEHAIRHELALLRHVGRHGCA